MGIFRLLVLLVASVVYAGLFAQKQDSIDILKQAHKHIAVLSADLMCGRGYTSITAKPQYAALAGNGLAANYLQQAFVNELGASARLSQQKFTFSVNLISSAYLKGPSYKHKGAIGAQPVVGIDFIPHAASPPVASLFKYVDGGYAMPTDLKEADWQDKIVFIQEGLPPNHTLPDSLAKVVSKEGYKIEAALYKKAKALVIVKRKITHTFSADTLPLPVLLITDNFFQKWKAGDLSASKSFVEVEIESRITQVAAQNIIAVWPAQNVTDSTIIFSAHYDHLGSIATKKGKPAIFRGANDNASGVAFLLGLARKLKDAKLKYNLVFIATSAEEVGLVGSNYYVQHPVFPLAKTKFVLNFDLMGNGEKGVVAVAGKQYPGLLHALNTLNDKMHMLPDSVRARENRPNSDHWPFTQAGVPALFFYTEGGKGYYHDVYDTPESVSLPVFYNFLKLVEAFIRNEATLPR